MSIATQISALQQDKSDIATAITNKGGTVNSGDGFDDFASDIATIPTGSSPVITSLNVTPTTSAQTITAPSGTDGYSPVNVSAVTASIDQNISAGNIKKDVQILGVTGTYEGTTPTLTTKNITANGTYNASSDNADGYSSVTVNVSGGGSFVGLNREIVNGKFSMPTASFSLPSNATDLGQYVMYYAFYYCTGLTSANLNNLTTISGNYAMEYAFRYCTGLTSIDSNNLITISGQSAVQYAFQGCTGLTSANFNSLTTISGRSAMCYAFSGCTNLTSIDLSSLTTISGYQAMGYAFQNCKKLTTLSFPSLTSTGFGSNTNQFNGMLSGVSGCKVHFPSNLQSVIGSWSSVKSGFGGTNTKVLFDLPATS